MESYIYKHSNNLFNRWQKRYLKLINKQLIYTLTDSIDIDEQQNKKYIDCQKIIELGNGNKGFDDVDISTYFLFKVLKF